MDQRKERFLVIDPDGSLRWIFSDRRGMCEVFRKAIGCNWLEKVYTVLPDIVIIVDEVGKVKLNPQRFNPVASRLYRGSLYGDMIHGPAVVAAIHLVDGEPDWVPCTPPELLRVQSFLQIDLSQAKEVAE